ncbi:MAG: hypothetical protein U0M12_05415 [Acutalibacteraceae bacterium]|nr:hypothetical protein [Acutalibacteraceae bacterium]
MRWINAELYTKEQTGKDKLKNPIYEDKKTADIKVRLTPWNTSMQVAMGQEYLKVHRKFITPSSADSFAEPYLCSVVIDGKKYAVEDVKALGKFTSVTVKAVK